MPDAATTAWVNQVVTNGGTVSAGRESAVDALIVGLKADGVWAKLERLWLFAPRGEAFSSTNAPAALTDLVGDTLATLSGVPTFSVDGYTGVDSDSAPFIDTGYDASGSSLYTLNDAHYSIWCMTNLTGAGISFGRAIIYAPTSLSNMFLTFNDGHTYYTINGPQADAGILATRIGHWVANRTGASLDSLYQSGSLVIAGNGTVSGSLTPGQTFTILANNLGLGGNLNTFSVASMGASLTTGQITSFYNRLTTYLSTPLPSGAVLTFSAQTLSIPLKTTANIKITLPPQ